MAVDGITSRVFREAAIPGLTDTGSLSPVITDPSGTKSFPTLTPAQSAANLKAAGADPSKAVGSGDPLTKAAGGSLDKNAFLKLLVQEMTNQDPLKPADNTQFIAPLAQFSTLEQMQNMNTGFKSLQTSFQTAEARGLIGVPIKAVNSTTGEPINGVVDQIILTTTTDSAGTSVQTVQVDVNGVPVSLSDIIAVGPGAGTGSGTSSPNSSNTNPGSTPTSGTSAAPLPGTLVPGSGQ
jgi:flagellar basal-body rod modification protein FlgD